MAYERAADLVALAICLQGRGNGVTLDEIEREFSVGRRTAERMRNAVARAFGALESEQVEGKKRWRLRSEGLRGFVSVSTEDLSALSAAVEALEGAGLAEHAARLEAVAEKLRAMLRAARRAGAAERLEADLEALLRAEGLAMRPGPRQPVDPEVPRVLRDAMHRRRKVEFDYRSRSTGRRSRQIAEPCGLLYGNRPFLVARTGWSDEPRLWRLANMSGARLALDDFEPDPDFDLRAFARRSFGTWQEAPVKVALRFDARAAPDAATFLFHPDQTVTKNANGTVTVRFEAGGLDEMCWHLVTWGDTVTIEKPARLRRKLSKMCETLAAHHG